LSALSGQVSTASGTPALGLGVLGQNAAGVELNTYDAYDRKVATVRDNINSTQNFLRKSEMIR
jgi:hypothetical protein